MTLPPGPLSFQGEGEEVFLEKDDVLFNPLEREGRGTKAGGFEPRPYDVMEGEQKTKSPDNVGAL